MPERKNEQFYHSRDAALRAAPVSAKRISQAILAKAFRGELVPPDPKDEPASVLLERIKTERENF